MLTATPIQNRLWDLYSLVDLLTVARGHQNPFGSEGMFARKFIADDRGPGPAVEARSARDEFRSIVYGYMSRVRAAMPTCHFPDRVVLLHTLTQRPEELQLIRSSPSRFRLNRLAQISILQALTSSPDALDGAAQQHGAERNRSQDSPPPFGTIVKRDAAPARSFRVLARWSNNCKGKPAAMAHGRVHRRRETQTTIQAFLEKQGIQSASSMALPGAQSGDHRSFQERIRRTSRHRVDRSRSKASTFRRPTCLSTTTCPGTR